MVLRHGRLSPVAPPPMRERATSRTRPDLPSVPLHMQLTTPASAPDRRTAHSDAAGHVRMLSAALVESGLARAAEPAFTEEVPA